MIIGNKNFDIENNAYVMGILNVTPDSFSDGGKFNSIDRALKHTEEMIDGGASIIDVGGESTRPGYTLVSDEEEIERTAYIIRSIKERFDTVVSLDTYKSAVAAAGIDAGADMINDIWGLKYDNDMAKVISDADVSCVLMHNRNSDNCSVKCEAGVCGSVADDVLSDLRETVFLAKQAGIDDEKIVLDPGIGFGKTYGMNLDMLNNLSQLKQLGYPILLGTSRKSVIGLTLDTPVQERVAGTVATTVMGLMAGCRFFRVHDVRENMDAIRMTLAVTQRR